MNTLTNNVQLIGNLGKDPEIKTTQNGRKMARFSIATKEVYMNAEGKRVENTQWVQLIAWGELAGIAEKYLVKGKQIAVCGKLNQREYVDPEGHKKYITEVVLSDILLLGKKES